MPHSHIRTLGIIVQIPTRLDYLQKPSSFTPEVIKHDYPGIPIGLYNLSEPASCAHGNIRYDFPQFQKVVAFKNFSQGQDYTQYVISTA